MTQRRLRVYISGPLTAENPQTKRQHISTAEMAWFRLRDAGFAPLCPHLTYYLEQDCPRLTSELEHGDWLAVDLPWVEASDAVLMLPGWQASRGARMEHERAIERGIPVFESVEAAQRWAGMRPGPKPEPWTPVEELLRVVGAEGERLPQSGPAGNVRYATGAVRSADAEGERFDLVTPIGLRRVAATCAEGAAKYGDFNWEKGMPVRDLLNHALRHIYLYLGGDRSEDHLGHAGWNVLGACHSEELWTGLNAGTLRGEGCRPPAKPDAA